MFFRLFLSPKTKGRPAVFFYILDSVHLFVRTHTRTQYTPLNVTENVRTVETHKRLTFLSAQTIWILVKSLRQQRSKQARSRAAELDLRLGIHIFVCSSWYYWISRRCSHLLIRSIDRRKQTTERGWLPKLCIQDRYELRRSREVLLLLLLLLLGRSF